MYAVLFMRLTSIEGSEAAGSLMAYQSLHFSTDTDLSPILSLNVSEIFPNCH